MDIPHRVHLIGIGGIGISALARLLLYAGHEISGTEDNESHETLDALRAAGVVISAHLDPKNLPAAECYIYSDAGLTKHIEVLAAARSRATALRPPRTTTTPLRRRRRQRRLALGNT